jgi:hypothetical protein
MPLNSFADVQKFFNDFINMHKITVGQPHGEFWNTLSYTDFVTGTVPGVTVPNTDPPQTIPILTKGDGKNSNIVQALAGTGMFDPNTGSFPQMPYEGPYFSTAQIQELSDWITNGCPE